MRFVEGTGHMSLTHDLYKAGARLSMAVTICLCGSLLGPLGLAEPQEALASEWRVFRPTCPCCQSDPAGDCCQAHFCNPAMMSTMDFGDRVEFLSRANSNANDEKLKEILGSCPLRAGLKIEHYSESAAAMAFFKSDAIKKCNMFVPDFLQVRQRILQAWQSNYLTVEDVAMSQKYINSCRSQGTSVFKPALSDDEAKKISRRVILLVTDGGQPYCHGFRLDHYILTADHCLRDVKVGDQISIRTLSSPEVLKAKLVMRGGEDNAKHLEKDYAILKTDGAFHDENTVVKNWIGAPQANSRLFLFQVNIYELIAAKASLQSNFEPFLTREDNPACRIFAVTDQPFLLNGCQTESGTSGAAYIQKDAKGDLRVVGVHSGLTDTITAEGLGDCSISLPNYGVKLPLAETLKILQAGE
jgi:hypothetical protein